MQETVLNRIQIQRKLVKGEVLKLDSHFDLLPVRKYRDYCGITSFRCNVDSDGPLAVKVLLYDSACSETVVDSPDFEAGENVVAGFCIEALEDCTVYSMYITCQAEPKEINLALCICTYHLEDAVRDKVAKVGDLAEIYITDNGQSLGDVPGAHVFPSPNYGGSSGFTNSLVEAAKNPVITHFILNDDDADLDPEVLFRTKAFLSLCQKDVCICGSMIDADDRCSIVESGSRFEGTEILPFDKDCNITNLEDNVKMERPKDIQYGGWWYFVLSRSAFEETGLPLPLFIKMDDVEYGCRINREKITLVGVSVFHRDFASKYSPVNYYYYIRNLLVTGCVSGKIEKHHLDEIISKIYLEIACYRYSNAEMMILAVKDFLKGPEHVFNQYKEGMIKPLTPVKIIPLWDFIETPIAKPAGFSFRKYTMNGALLPSKGKVRRKIGDMQTSDFYRVGEVLYEIDDESGFLADKSLLSSISLTVKTKTIGRTLGRDFDRLSKQYVLYNETYTNSL
ncbi:MAG: hypothetical protein MJZ38_02545 [archaeon]|nr:hypothetical protein [archaeon]